MDAVDIKAAIKRAGSSVQAIAREMDVNESAVRSVVEGRGRSSRIEAAVGALLRLSPSDIWPQWYPQGSVAAVGVGAVAAGRNIHGSFNTREPAVPYDPRPGTDPHRMDVELLRWSMRAAERALKQRFDAPLLASATFIAAVYDRVRAAGLDPRDTQNFPRFHHEAVSWLEAHMDSGGTRREVTRDAPE